MQIIAQHSSGSLPLELKPSKHAEHYADNLVTLALGQHLGWLLGIVICQLTSGHA
jgi:hypothetical protein